MHMSCVTCTVKVFILTMTVSFAWQTVDQGINLWPVENKSIRTWTEAKRLPQSVPDRFNAGVLFLFCDKVSPLQNLFHSTVPSCLTFGFRLNRNLTVVTCSLLLHKPKLRVSLVFANDASRCHLKCKNYLVPRAACFFFFLEKTDCRI